MGIYVLKYKAIIQELESLSKPENVKGMAKFGINSKNAFGVKMPELLCIAKKTGKIMNLLKNCGMQDIMKLKYLQA